MDKRGKMWGFKEIIEVKEFQEFLLIKLENLSRLI